VKFKPVGDRVLVKPVGQQEQKTESGIVLPDTATKEREQTAEVVSVGDSAEVKVSKGNLVVFNRYSGTEIKLDNESHLVLESDELLGVVEG